MLRGLERSLARRRVRRREEHFSAKEPDPSLARGTDRLGGFEHLVVLMMENHSFDNYLGMLGRGDGFALDARGRPSETNPAADGEAVPLVRRPVRQVPVVPTQSWHASHIQYDGGSNDGFVRSVEETLPGCDARMPMTYWTEEDLPFYYGLARTFPLADRWFSSCLGPTFPNRRFLVAGTAHGLLDDLPFNLFDHPKSGTILDLMTAHGVSWANYHHISRFRVNWRRFSRARGVSALRRLGFLVAAVVRPLRTSLESKVQATADVYPLGFLGLGNHLRPIDAFWRGVADGRLPSVSIVDPDFERCSEENPQDIQAGEGFAAKVVEAVMAGPKWSTTLLIWVYDEHGGYFDHVAPPAAPTPDGVPGHNPARRPVVGWLLRRFEYGRQIDMLDEGPTSYDRLGFRVPAVVISPYAKPDYVSSTPFDHTSILKLIELKWNLPSLTARDAAAVAPLDCLDFAASPTFLSPPRIPAPARPWKG
ncbi:MAG TPA: alkaline phosphatase family protein [Acidimicrobiales bacterium]|nr:alkaline phosphatase family protein [Acidimicrobiales bacterium]